MAYARALCCHSILLLKQKSVLCIIRISRILCILCILRVLCTIRGLCMLRSLRILRGHAILPADLQATRQQRSAFNNKLRLQHHLSCMLCLFLPPSQYMSPAIMIQSHISSRYTLITLSGPFSAFFLVIYRQPGNRNPVFWFSAF